MLQRNRSKVCHIFGIQKPFFHFFYSLMIITIKHQPLVDSEECYKNSKELMFRKVIKFQNFYYRFHKWELLEFSQLNSKVNTYTNSNFGRPIWRQITNLIACSRATCGMYSLNYVNNLQTNQANVSTNRIGTGLYA